MIRKSVFMIIVLLILLFTSCSPAPTPAPTALPTSTSTPLLINTSTSTCTPEPTPTATKTPIPTKAPFDLSSIIFPISIDDVRYFRFNFGCPTDYGDYTHDGFDIPIILGKKIPVIAVANGQIHSTWVSDSVKYEIRLDVGQDVEGERLSFYFIHVDEIIDNLSYVNQGDIIGYLYGMDHLHFELRRGLQPRLESPSDGMQGDEIDMTDLLLVLVKDIGIPEEKLIIGCSSPY